ncbi:MAG TPA: nucleotidyltransferase [Actinomycetota bacterium]|nr:nucleotidyltransferase [Actinomycetota bacterium]
MDEGGAGRRRATLNGADPAHVGTSRGDDPDREELLGVLVEVLETMDRVGSPFVFIGGIASMLLGRRRWTRDLDVLVRIEDAPEVLDALGEAGFRTEQTFPHWLYKARKGRVQVDVIFRSTRDVMLDDEMLERSVWRELEGHRVRLAPPEDLVVMKAVAADEDTPRYWYDALAILAHSEIDWNYLLRRAHQHGARRILSLLLYAQSNDLLVPNGPIEALSRRILGDDAEARDG